MGKLGIIYRGLLGHITGRPTYFSWLPDHKIAASGRPMTFRELAWVVDQGVRSVLSLTEGPLPQDWLARLGLNYLHVPMMDHSSPTVSELEVATQYIGEQVALGNPILVHCAAGVGRTGTVLAAYLIRCCGLDVEQALRTVRRTRPKSVEEGQESALAGYQKWLLERRFNETSLAQ